MPAKSLIFALTASLSAHALAVYSLGHSWAPVRSEFENTYQISYVQYETSFRARSPRRPSEKSRGISATTGFLAPSGLEMTKATPSADLLTDPVKGPIFQDYFSAIRKKIQNRLSKGYSQQLRLNGEVTLLFVLSADGALRTFSVNDRESSAGTLTQHFALECLRGSAPFAPFPQVLGVKQISFQITLCFPDQGREGI